MCGVHLRGVHTGTRHDVAKAEAIANARRLAAAWNACDGIPTDVLQSLRPGDIAALLTGGAGAAPAPASAKGGHHARP